MSYILDALRKSEEERRRGELPDPRNFAHVPHAHNGQRRWLWPAIGAGLLVINAGALLFYLKPWRSADPAPSVSAAAEPGVAAPANQATAQAANLITATPQPVRPPVNQAPLAAPQAVPDSRASVSVQRPTAQPLPASASSNSLAPPAYNPEARQPSASTRAATAAPVSTPPPRRVTPAPRATPAYSQPAPAVTRIDPAPDPRPSSATRSTEGRYIPPLAELPASVRDELPELLFSSHMYSNTARYRSITINGRRLKEGQLLSADLVVHEITEKGVIMQFGKILFEVDVLAQW